MFVTFLLMLFNLASDFFSQFLHRTDEALFLQIVNLHFIEIKCHRILEFFSGSFVMTLVQDAVLVANKNVTAISRTANYRSSDFIDKMKGSLYSKGNLIFDVSQSTTQGNNETCRS